MQKTPLLYHWEIDMRLRTLQGFLHWISSGPERTAKKWRSCSLFPASKTFWPSSLHRLWPMVEWYNKIVLSKQCTYDRRGMVIGFPPFYKLREISENMVIGHFALRAWQQLGNSKLEWSIFKCKQTSDKRKLEFELKLYIQLSQRLVWGWGFHSGFRQCQRR